MSDTSLNPSDADAFTHAVAGAAGGALSITLTYPLMSLTTKLQTTSDDEKKQSTREVVKNMLQKDGWKAMFSGLESAIYGMTLSNFVYYYFYELSSGYVKKIFGSKQLNTLESFLVGTVAGSATATASNPLWVANTRMTVQKSSAGTFQTIYQISRDEGFQALFKGLKPALVLVINPIIQYTVFEQLKNTVLNLTGSKVLSPSWAFLLGALGKLVATGLTYPYVTMKTKMQNQKTVANERPSAVLSTLLESVKKNGPMSLYRGIGIKLVQSILTAAFLFFFKEGLVLWSMRLFRLLRTARARAKQLRI
ncbi:LAMI_0E14356g1_1 [Lachancea mirantina]|uniref:LAMI_0E14356g1_1 n=1 Tax=Lachancea mirantina TaxID=1230905 RepID=A0A1G4JRH9_9SACH|nr:LAMI_0E14356g1_1 [Lachancea mirantina]